MAEIDLEGSELLSPEEAAQFFPGDTPDFQVIDTPTDTLFDPERNKTFAVPLGATGREVDFLLQRDGDKKPAENFLGPFDFSGAANDVKNGFLSFFAATPQIDATLKKEFGERLKQELNEPLNFGDALDAISPFANQGAASGATSKIFAAFTGDKSGVERKLKIADRMTAEADASIRRNQQTMQRLGLVRPEGGALLFDIGSGTATVGSAVAVTLLTRSPKTAALFFGTLQKTQIYQEAREKGLDPEKASQLSGLAGVVEGGIEAIGGKIFLKLSSLDKPLKRVLLRVVEESAQEAAQQTGEEIITQAAGVRELDVAGGVGRVAYSAMLGAIVSAPVSTVAELAESAAREEGVDPGLAKIIARKIQENAGGLVEEAANIIKEINADITIDPKAQKEVSEIIRKFVSGEDINIEDALGKVPADVAAVLGEAVEGVSEAKDISGKVTRGRVRELGKQIASLDRQIAEVESRIEDRDAAGQSSGGLQNKILRLAARREALETEQDDLTGKEAGAIENARKLLDERRDDLESLAADAKLTIPPAPKGESLMAFIRGLGGVRDEGGDLRSMGITRRGFVNNNTGVSLDEALSRAVEAGFFRDIETGETITGGGLITADLLEAIADEFNGRRTRFADDAIEQELAERDAAIRAKDEATRALEDLGINTDQTAAQIIKTLEDVARPTGEKDVSVKGAVLESLNQTTTKEAIRNLRKGFRLGLKAAKTNTKEAQTALVNLVKKSGLSLNDQAKFIAAIKNTQTVEQLQKRLPGIQSRVIGLLESQRRREIQKALKRIVRKTKPKKTGGKLRGKFTPEIQEILDEARGILGLSVAAARERLEAALSSETPTPDAAFENRLLAIAARSEDLTISDMEAALIELAEVRAEGTAGAKARLSARRAKSEALIVAVSDAVTQSKDIDAATTTSIASRVVASAKLAKDTIATAWDGWNEILDITINKKGVDAGSTIKALTVTREIQARKKLMLEWGQKFTDLGMAAFGFTKQKQLMAQLAKDSERQNLGTFTDVTGRRVVLEYSVSEARKLWMEAQDPSIADTLTDPNGNAFTDEMQDTVFGLLGQEDIAYAQAQLDFYQSLYSDINTVFAKLYGVNLPSNDFYSPIARDRGGRPVQGTRGQGEAGVGARDDIARNDNFLRELQYRRTVTSSSLKDRTKNVLPLKRRDDTAVMLRYLHDMAHFIALAEKARTLNAVFGNVRLRKEIQASHSVNMVRQIDAFLEDINRGYLQRGLAYEDAINFFNRNFARSVLALKAQIGIKQLTSIFAYAENISGRDFVAGALDFAANPKKAAETLFELSPLLQERGSAQDIEIAKLVATDKALVAFRKRQSFENLLSVFIRYGDRAPIYVGGWAVYRAARKAGKSKQEAIAEFEAITASTQQSTDFDQLSGLQRSGPLGRTLSMFMSAPISLMKGEMRAIRRFSRGKINAREFGKRMAIYHVIIPMAFQFAASGLRFEPDKQLVAFVLGSFNGLVILGDVIKKILYDLLAENSFNITDEIPLAEVIKEIFRGAGDAIQATDSEEFVDALKELSEAAGKATGLPVEQGFNFAAGAAALAEGETRTGTLLILGWPPSVASEE